MGVRASPEWIEPINILTNGALPSGHRKSTVFRNAHGLRTQEYSLTILRTY